MTSPYTFESEPKVVRNKPKYKPQNTTENTAVMNETGENGDFGGKSSLNIMYDKRVFRGNTHNMNNIKKTITPQQQEELKIKAERENKKVEMIKQQLIVYKKGKNKTAPYDLRPGPPARIEVDLTYFLTEQNTQKPEEVEEKVQTDTFVPKPPTPPYIPKKTGIDAMTQIWDYDLFNYDKEVEPILHVLVSKTLEQAALEVEEETEISHIKKYKEEHRLKKKLENEDWEQEVKQEIARIKNKNKVVNAAREKKKRQIATMHKIQALNISKEYLRNLLPNSILFLRDHSLWRNEFTDQMHIDYIPWAIDNARASMHQADTFEKDIDKAFKKAIKKIEKEKEGVDAKRKKLLEKKKKARAIEVKDKRVLRILFENIAKPKISQFTKKFMKMLEGKLEEYEELEESRFIDIQGKIDSGEFQETIDLPQEEEEESPNFIVELTDLKKVIFAAADDPYYEIPMKQRRYVLECILYNSKGEVKNVFNSESKKSKIFTYQSNCRDRQLKENDDERIIIDTNQLLKKDRYMVLFVIKRKENQGIAVKESQYDGARFRLADKKTYQTIDSNELKDQKDPLQAEAQPDDPELMKEYITLGGRLFVKDKMVYYESMNYKMTVTDTLLKDIGHVVTHCQIERQFVFPEKKQVTQPDQPVPTPNTSFSKIKKQQEAQSQKKKEEEAKKKKEEEEKKKREDELKAQNPGALLAEDLNDPEKFVKYFKKFDNTTLGPVKFKIDEDLEKAQEEIIKALKERDADLYTSCVFGFDILINNREFSKLKQVFIHGKNLQKIVVRPKLPPPQEEVQEPSSTEHQVTADDE